MLLLVLLCPPAAGAHHSAAAVYDTSSVRELEGTVTRVLWQNPHVRFTIKVRNSQRGEEIWNVETQSVSILSRMRILPGVLKVGDNVRVAGNPGKGGANEIYVHNLLLPDGQEVLLQPGTTSRWSGRTVGKSDTWLATAGAGSDPGRGIFRVWSTSLASPGLFGPNGGYPLTPTARDALSRFDMKRDDPLRDCAPKGMPTIMSPPYPIEFARRGDSIVLRIEEFDTVRTIHMDTGAAARTSAPSLLGFSVGRWEGNTLVVHTTGASWGHFTTTGIPLSAAADMAERFTPTVDGSRLDYEMTVTDPATFTRPVVLKKHWIWLPDAKISPYKCTNGR